MGFPTKKQTKKIEKKQWLQHFALWIATIAIFSTAFYATGMFDDLKGSLFQAQFPAGEIVECVDNALFVVSPFGEPLELFKECPRGCTPGANFCSKTVFDGGGSIAGLKELEVGLSGKGVSTEESIIVVILGWVDFALPFAGLFSFVGLVYAGFLYVTAFGNEDQTGKAKNIVIWVSIGLVLIFSAYAITNTIIGASTVTTP